jgi:hypothetical protein
LASIYVIKQEGLEGKCGKTIKQLHQSQAPQWGEIALGIWAPTDFRREEDSTSGGWTGCGGWKGCCVGRREQSIKVVASDRAFFLVRW